MTIRVNVANIEENANPKDNLNDMNLIARFTVYLK